MDALGTTSSVWGIFLLRLLLLEAHCLRKERILLLLGPRLLSFGELTALDLGTLRITFPVPILATNGTFGSLLSIFDAAVIRRSLLLLTLPAFSSLTLIASAFSHLSTLLSSLPSSCVCFSKIIHFPFFFFLFGVSSPIRFKPITPVIVTDICWIRLLLEVLIVQLIIVFFLLEAFFRVHLVFSLCLCEMGIVPLLPPYACPCACFGVNLPRFALEICM